MKAYGVATHRHTPEIEEQLGYAAGYPITINFTPHLVPMNRGILATAYASLKEGVTEEQVTDLINAETWMTAEEAKEIFDVQIEERPAVAACVGWMMENFKKAPEGIKTQSADDVTAKITAEEEAIIEEMELFGI